MGDAIDASSPAEAYHELRKKGKELRYLLELFGVAAVPRGGRQADDQVAQGAPGRARPPPGPRGPDRVAAVARARRSAEAAGGDAALMAIGALVARLGEDERAARGEFAGRFAEFSSERTAAPGQGDVRVSTSDFGHLPTTTYEADPSQVHRVLLLYSGGLDTSVMLKWIQEQYQAEVVALTVNLGQPGEDYEVIRGQGAAARRARLPRGRRARGVRARVRRARDQGQRRSTGSATRCSPRSGGR